MDWLGTGEGTLYICYGCGFEWLVNSKNRVKNEDERFEANAKERIAWFDMLYANSNMAAFGIEDLEEEE
jgi:hypothetical protein